MERFENLTGDPAQDWVAAAISAVVAAQLTGSPHLKVLSINNLRELSASGATLALHGYLTVESGKLSAHAALVEVASGRTRKSISASGPADPLSLAGTVARAVDERARPFGTRQTSALRPYVEALSAERGGDPPGAALERAVAADPDFGEAYVAWAQALLARGDRAGAHRVFAAARERYGSFQELPRAQLEVLSQFFEGLYASRRHALLALSRLTPADGAVFSRLGALDLAAKQFAPAVEWYKQAIEREPANPLLLNEMAYAQAYSGDLDGAVKSLREYQALRPSDANPLDSLGDVHYLRGRFRDAERFYLEVHAKNPGFGGGAGDLAKAAQARLMAGDPAGAAGIFNRYLEARRAMRDPFLEHRQAQWEILSGNRPQAAARLEKLAASQHPAAFPALIQLCALSLDAGDRERARQYAARAARIPGAKGQPLTALCDFASLPSAPAGEWKTRAGQMKQGPLALALALLFDRHFAEAAPIFRQMYTDAPPSSPEPFGVYLAWALIESGRAGEAKSPLSILPLPQPNNDQPFAILALARLTLSFR